MPLIQSDDFAAEPRVVDVSMFEGEQGGLWPWLVEVCGGVILMRSRGAVALAYQNGGLRGNFRRDEEDTPIASNTQCTLSYLVYPGV